MDRMKGIQKGKGSAQAGFSLVELIIVIAIMAILIAVLAPQYLKYVEKTKANKDADAFGKVVQLVEYTIADENDNLTSDQIEVVWNTSAGRGATFTVTGVDSNFLNSIGLAVNGNATDFSLPCTSRSFKAAGSVKVTFTYNESGTVWTKVSSNPFSNYVTY